MTTFNFEVGVFFSVHVKINDKTVCKIYTYFKQISILDSIKFQSCVLAGKSFKF